MGSNESIKYTIKTDDEKIARIVVATFELYRARPQYGILPVIDTTTSFHLIYGDKNREEKWLNLFTESVILYCEQNLGMKIVVTVNKGEIYFAKESKRPNEPKKSARRRNSKVQ